ncbi:MAG: outer membrane beta-barrel protein [Sphingobacteriales bacterium]|nr:outer membrane beta-barrel protein [Sphingobacteriales bacterium]MBP8192827.1 outer membrane beta-barrel protein [Chitinophagales bacterium]
MKKIYFILFILFAVNAFSDDTLVVDKSKYTRLHFEGFRSGKRMHLQLGGDIGLNLNYFIYKENRSRTYKDIGVGYQGGFFFRVSKGSIYTQFDFNFLRTTFPVYGVTFADPTVTVNETRLRFNSLGIPIVLGIYAYKNPLFKLRFFTGIEPYFMVKSRIFYDISVNGDEQLIEYKLSRAEKRKFFKPAQLSYQFGSGVDIGMFTIDFKYSIGLVNYIKDDYVRTQTHLFQLMMGVIF